MTSPRLRLGLEHDHASRGRHVRDIVQELKRLHWVRGALLVAADGFVIAAEMPPAVAVEPLAALTATLGRELETSATRMGRPAFCSALFSADDGAMFLATSRIGYLVVMADQQVNVQAVRGALADAVALIDAAWGMPETYAG
jgi:predicted regulator of Ras-like GTPase activity (Roadblock/LC7/MglB family)